MAADFVDLLAWQEGVVLVREVVRLAPQVRGVGAEEVVDQMLRAAESVPANVADGYELGLGRDCARCLRVAAASAAEVEGHVRVAEASGRLRAEAALELVRRARRARALIVGLRRSVRGRKQEGAALPNAPARASGPSRQPAPAAISHQPSAVSPQPSATCALLTADGSHASAYELSTLM